MSAQGEQAAAPSGVRRWALIGVVAVWGAVVVGGTLWTWKYKSTPAETGVAPARWPGASTLARRPGRPTLVMFAHPRCVCTRASLTELGALLAEVGSAVDATIVFVRPEGTGDDWMESDLWRAARTVPSLGVTVDRGGRESERFGALASGTVVLYDRDGRLLFSGGITAARGHVGDNLGRRRVVALITNGAADLPMSPVFGCELRNPGEKGTSR